MRLTPVQLFLILLNEGDPQSHYGIKYYFKKHFGEDPSDFSFLHKALSELEANEVVAEYDLETDGGVDVALFSHPEYGSINFSEFDGVDGLDAVFHLSRGTLKFAMENVAELTDEAARNGFDKALKVMTSLPIDSTAWTGLPKGFVLNDHAKKQLVDMLEKGADALEKSGLSNSEIGQGAAYMRAARTLLEAPEPPENEILKILMMGSAIASIASFFLPIISYFKSPQ